METDSYGPRETAVEGEIDHGPKNRNRRRNNELIDLAESHRSLPQQEKNDRRNDPQRPVALPHKNSLTNWSEQIGVMEYCFNPPPHYSITPALHSSFTSVLLL